MISKHDSDALLSAKLDTSNRYTRDKYLNKCTHGMQKYCFDDGSDMHAGQKNRLDIHPTKIYNKVNP